MVSATTALNGYASTDNIKITVIMREVLYYTFEVNAPNVYTLRGACVPVSQKQGLFQPMVAPLTYSCQKMWAVCEMIQQVSSHWFEKHLRQCCTQNSERLLWMPVDEKDGLRKIANIRQGAYIWLQQTDAQRTGRFPFHGITKSDRTRREEPNNKAWSFTHTHTHKQQHHTDMHIHTHTHTNM